MAAYKVEICGVNTAKLPILKESEKEELFAKIKQGDIDVYKRQSLCFQLRLRTLRFPSPFHLLIPQ